VFCERIDLPAADNQMVRDADIHQLKYLNQSLREGFVGLAGCRLAGRMVMRQYHRRRIEIQARLTTSRGCTSVRLIVPLKSVSWAITDSGCPDTTPELFPLKRGHMQSQPFTYGVGGGEGHPGLMQVRSRALSAR
jgi:hypothetical protein